MKKIRLIALIAACMAPYLLIAQTVKTGTTAAQVLKLNVGARPIAMGGAFTATSDDIYSLFWNPAGAATIKGNEASFVHSGLYADISHDFAGVITNINGFGSLGAFVTVLSMDEMPVRTIESPEGTGELFGAGAMVIGLNYARNLTDNFSIGFNAKYVSEYIYNMRANGFAVDIGTLYRIPVMNELRIGANISNFGTKMKLEGRDNIVITTSGAGGGNLINSYIELDQYDLPLIFRFGVASDVIKEEQYRMTVAMDAVHPNDHTEYVNFGMEFGWNNTLFVRGGYNSVFEKDTEKGLTAGFGINYTVMDLVAVKVDYAYQDFGRLGDIQYFSLGVRF